MIVIQDNTINNVYGYFFSDDGRAGSSAIVVSVAYVGGTLGARSRGRRHGIPIRDPLLLVAEVRGHPRDHALSSSGT